jgi:hypothetical protein
MGSFSTRSRMAGVSFAGQQLFEALPLRRVQLGVGFQALGQQARTAARRSAGDFVSAERNNDASLITCSPLPSRQA